LGKELVDDITRVNENLLKIRSIRNKNIDNNNIKHILLYSEACIRVVLNISGM